MITVDADRSFSVLVTQLTPRRHHMIPGYLSREVNARTVLPFSDYARGGLTRFEIIVYGTLTPLEDRIDMGTTRRRDQDLPECMRVTRGHAQTASSPLSGRRLAKIRQAGANSGARPGSQPIRKDQRQRAATRCGRDPDAGAADLPSCCRLRHPPAATRGRAAPYLAGTAAAANAADFGWRRSLLSRPSTQ